MSNTNELMSNAEMDEIENRAMDGCGNEDDYTDKMEQIEKSNNRYKISAFARRVLDSQWSPSLLEALRDKNLPLDVWDAIYAYGVQMSRNGMKYHRMLQDIENQKANIDRLG